MSRGFVKEDDKEELPIVPPRSFLPDSETNYVTVYGLNELQKERDNLSAERDALDTSNENERRIAVNYINAKLLLLNNRITTAKIVALSEQPQDEVRFGATITLKIENEKNLQKYQIVGVDEADIAKKKISFLAPIARVLTDKKVGEKAILKLEKSERIFEIVAIEYV